MGKLRAFCDRGEYGIVGNIKKWKLHNFWTNINNTFLHKFSDKYNFRQHNSHIADRVFSSNNKANPTCFKLGWFGVWQLISQSLLLSKFALQNCTNGSDTAGLGQLTMQSERCLSTISNFVYSSYNLQLESEL